MSFRNPVTFSMVASRERQHPKRVPKIGKYKTGILPVAAIYGGNASGKTNLFRALKFTQTMIVRGTQPDSLISVERFRLDAEGGFAPRALYLGVADRRDYLRAQLRGDP
jgi:AAA15 family ATPase/GTPase